MVRAGRVDEIGWEWLEEQRDGRQSKEVWLCEDAVVVATMWVVVVWWVMAINWRWW